MSVAVTVTARERHAEQRSISVIHSSCVQGFVCFPGAAIMYSNSQQAAWTHREPPKLAMSAAIPGYACLRKAAPSTPEAWAASRWQVQSRHLRGVAGDDGSIPSPATRYEACFLSCSSCLMLCFRPICVASLFGLRCP